MGSKASRTSLSDALFSKTQQRVLGVLFGRPDQSFFANEIVRLAGGGFGAVHRELGVLETAGLVTVTRIGNQKHYQANREAPIYEELRGIVLKTVGLADVLRKALAPLAPRIRAAFVYGSVAKGTDTARSDIDLMVIGGRCRIRRRFQGNFGRRGGPRTQGQSHRAHVARAQERKRGGRLPLACSRSPRFS